LTRREGEDSSQKRGSQKPQKMQHNPFTAYCNC
jgi:hypothetical protein